MLNQNKTNSSLLHQNSSKLSSDSSFDVSRSGPKVSIRDAPREVMANKKFYDDEISSDISEKTSRKQVSFKGRVKVKKISSHKYYSTEERDNLWYNQEEMKQIRKDAVLTVKKMMRGINIDQDDEYCTRGLENKVPKKNKARQARKFEIICSVLDEQENQLIEADRRGEADFLLNVEALAYVYITAGSYRCAAEAVLRGKKDESAALL